MTPGAVLAAVEEQPHPDVLSDRMRPVKPERIQQPYLNDAEAL